MPVLEIGLAAAAVAAAATTSYLVPMIMSCVGGVILAIGTFYAGFKMAERDSEIELVDLKRQQHQRDQQTKQDAHNIVQHTERHVKRIIQQTEKQQQRWEITVDAIHNHLAETSHATADFVNMTETFPEITAHGQASFEHLSSALTAQKNNLEALSQALKSAEQALLNKEAMLSATIDRLRHSEQQFHEDACINLKVIADLQQSLQDHLQTQAVLKHHNHELTQKVMAQEAMIQQFTQSLSSSVDQHAVQDGTLQKISQENQQLRSLVEQLTQTMAQNDEQVSQTMSAQKYNVRLF